VSSDSKYKLEYVWLDGYIPEPNLRSKTKIVDKAPKSIDDLAMWGFDGSSTKQAEGHSSDCLLKPVALYPDSGRKNAFLVMCEVLLPDGSPHPTNYRATVDDKDDLWIGLEQEYFFWEEGRALTWPEEGYPAPQGPYYTGVGFKNVGSIARQIVDEHIDICLDAGIELEGINAEVAKGQWEFQIFAKGSKKIGDDMWIARYLMLRTCEKYGIDIEWHCKPIRGDWNGSGMHTNFSTGHMRDKGGKDYFEKLMAAFDKYKDEHIAAYGPDNHLRLTGLHETQSIDKFNYGVANRGASIRIPHSFVKDGAYRGYVEDRRPNSQADPYKIISRLVKTINSVPTS
jgi:glutamine synthetase